MVPQSPRTRKAVAWIWYEGDLFRGFQRQCEAPTVQGELERALSNLGVKSSVVGAGRTDRGVHARMQVVQFRAPENTDLEACRNGLGRALPEGLGIAILRWAPPSFHCQWSSIGKEYRYRLLLGNNPPNPWRRFAWSPKSTPDGSEGRIKPETLSEVLAHAVGTHDFSSFHDPSSARRNRTLESAVVQELGSGLLEVSLAGNGFGRYQARVLVGTAAAVAAGRIPLEQFSRALHEQTPLNGIRAPGHGLILWKVRFSCDKDPFGPSERLQADGVPSKPPFSTGP